MNDLILKDLDSATVKSGGITLERNLPSLVGMTATATATAGTIAAVKDVIAVNPFTGAAAQAVTLPAADIGTRVVYALTVDTTGGTATLSFDCAGTDVYRTGSVVESRATNALTYDTSTAGETLLTFTPAAAVTNYISQGSKFIFWCTEDGVWDVHLEAKSNPASTGLTGATAFGA